MMMAASNPNKMIPTIKRIPAGCWRLPKISGAISASEGKDSRIVISKGGKRIKSCVYFPSAGMVMVSRATAIVMPCSIFSARME